MALDFVYDLVDYDQFYYSLFDLLKLSSDLVSSKSNDEDVSKILFSNQERTSISYNFCLCWSLLDPYVESSNTGCLPLSKKFFNESLNNIQADLNATNLSTGLEDSYSFIQTLRVGYTFVSVKEKDYYIK